MRQSPWLRAPTIAVPFLLAAITLTLAACSNTAPAQTATPRLAGTPGAVTAASDVVAQVGSVQLTLTDVSNDQTVAARVRRLNPAYNGLTPGTWVRNQILYQEAERRGLACTAEQAAAQLSSTYQQSVADGHPDDILITAEMSGLAPEGYSQTPDAARTPDTASVVQQYLNDPRVIRTTQEFCSISNLGRRVNTQSVNGFATIEAEATAVVWPPTETATSSATP